MFFLVIFFYGHEAMIAEDTDFKCEGEGEEVVKKKRVSMHAMTATFWQRNFQVFHTKPWKS